MPDPTPAETPPNEVLKTQPSPPSASPAAGGWKPDAATPLWASVLVGTLMASGPAIGTAVATWNLQVGIAIGAVLMGVAASLGAYYGIRSAGPRKDA